MGGNAFTSFPSVGGPVGGWVELGRTTLGSSNSDVSVSSLADKRYYQVLTYYPSISAARNANFRLNGDSGNNYSNRFTRDGAADGTETSNNYAMFFGNGHTNPIFSVSYFANKNTVEKLMQGWSAERGTTGAGNAPTHTESVGKHAQSTNPIDEITITTTDGTTYGTDSQMVVLGWDPADVHTNNFWEELGTDTGDGSSTDITVTFTAKKYLWIQAYIEGSVGAVQTFRLGSSSTPDTGNNYSSRVSFNGGTDGLETSVSSLIGNGFNDGTFPVLWNFFIINVAANEKLVIAHRINQNGTGATPAPARSEHVIKWTNTSNQADIFEVNRSNGNWTTSSIVKVWGSN